MSYLVAVVILASLRSLALLPLFAVPAAADFSMPNSSCITLDLFGCPTLLPAFEEEVGTAAEVPVEDTAVVSLLVESSCCFLPGLSKPVKVDDSLLASRNVLVIFKILLIPLDTASVQKIKTKRKNPYDCSKFPLHKKFKLILEQNGRNKLYLK